MEGSGKRKEIAYVNIYCTSCHKRLFSAAWDSAGTISIKCDRCKSVMAITLRGKADACVKTVNPAETVDTGLCMGARHRTDAGCRVSM